MLRKILAGVALAVGLIVATSGADAQRYDGSGVVKFGVFGQGTWLDVDQTLPTVAGASPSGYGGGVSLGYDWHVYKYWLLGLEIDGSIADARDRADQTDYGFDYLLTGRGRVGVFVRDDWLLYGTVGVGYLGIEAQRPGIGNKAVDTLTGVVAGAGTEIAWHHVVLFGEYLYGSYGDRDFRTGFVNQTAGFDSHLFRLGVKFKVGHDYAHSYDHPDHYRRGEPLK